MDQRISIEDLVRKEVRSLKAYHVEDAPCDVVLDANENPMSLPRYLKGEIQSRLNDFPINRYPDPSAKGLRVALAEMDGVSPDQILPGNGSDEIIQMLITVFCEKGASVLFPVPTFSMYDLITRAWGGVPVESPLKGDWDIDLPRFFEIMDCESPSVIFLASPNNPTGNSFPEEAVREILTRSRGVVVLDEAYFHFAGNTLLSLLDEFPNAVILRSLSKIGLAGLRLGYLIANVEIIELLNRVRLPYNISSLSQVVAEVVLKDRVVLEEQIERIKEERDRLFEALQGISGIVPFPSKANFILFRLKGEGADPGAFFNGLLKKGFRIRNLSRAPFLDNCFRVTIGTREENTAFLRVLEVPFSY